MDVRKFSFLVARLLLAECDLSSLSCMYVCRLKSGHPPYLPYTPEVA